MFVFLLGLLLVSLLLNNLKLALNGGLEVYDYGIYQQGVFELSRLKELNPFLTVRYIHLFNDHFAPIIFLAVPFAWLTQYHVSTLLFFEWFSFVLFIFLSLKLFRPKKILEVLAICFMILFSKGLLHAFIWPIHPGAWSTSAWILLVYFLYKKNERGIIGASLFLCLFRYSYPFCILTLGFYFALIKEWKKAGWLIFISCLFLGFIFIGRKMLWGSTHDYSSKVLGPLLSNPLSETLRAFREFDWSFAIKIFFPFILPFYFVIKDWKNKKYALNHELVAVGFLMAPYVLIHFLYNKFNFHYGIALVSPLIGVVLFSGSLQRILNNKKLVILFFLAFFFSGNSTYRRVIKKIMIPNVDGSFFIGEKREHMNGLKDLLKTLPLDKTIISNSTLATSVMFPGLKIYIPSVDEKPLPYYDYILVEKDFDEIKANCLSPSSNKIILENRYYVLIEGKIEFSCFRKIERR